VGLKLILTDFTRDKNGNSPIIFPVYLAEINQHHRYDIQCLKSVYVANNAITIQPNASRRPEMLNMAMLPLVNITDRSIGIHM
jgi:hypothetical protein